MKGMSNISANCFINSVFQSLFCIDRFNKSVLKQLKKNKELYQIPIVQQYCKIIQQNNQENIQVIDMRPMLSIIWDQRPDFREQSDGNEFLLWFVDNFYQQLKHKDIFEGEDTQQLLFACGHEISQKKDVFRSLILKNQQLGNAGPINLEDVLLEPHKEIVDGVICEVCKQEQPLEIIKFIKKLPQVLNVQSFNLKDKVLQNNIIIPQFLNLQLNEKKHVYELKSLILYSGNSLNGHFTAIVKNGQQWTICNDERISDINTEDVQRYTHLCDTILYEKK